MNEVNLILPLDQLNPVYSLSELAFKLHFQTYRVCCKGISQISSLAFTTLSFPIRTCFQKARRIDAVDFCLINSLKIANGTYSIIFKEPLISSDALKTLVQKKREREILELKCQLQEKKIYTNFSEALANYINEFIPRYVGEKCISWPSAMENWILFKLGYSFQYFNHQIEKRYHHHDYLSSHKIGKWFRKNNLRLETQFVHHLMKKDHLNPLLDFEHLFLSLSVKLAKEEPVEANHQLEETIVSALAFSFSKQKEIDQFLSQFQFTSTEEAFIARLEWYKVHNILPKGLPDPHVIRLTPQNLQEKLDEALNNYLEEHIEKFLNKNCPKSLKKGLVGCLYFLEGKDLLIQLFAHLIAEFGIKQLVDPHLFALAVLYGNGLEVMDYDLEGFGRGKREVILKTGQKMMVEAIHSNSHDSIEDIFNQSGLKYSPKSFEAFLQKKEAKEELKKTISSMLHQAIKKNNFQHPDLILKETREKVGQIPFIRAATLGLHLLINGTFFSLGYLFQTKDSHQSFLSWMLRHFSGKKLTDYLAERIVELIYHPSWRMTLLHLIEQTLSPNFQKTGEIKNKEILKEELLKITSFLFEHFTSPSTFPFQENMGSLIEKISGDTVLKIFLDALQTKGPPLIEKCLNSFSPTLKESLLHTRVVNSFRKEAVYFEGDAKFWEYFLREYLNQLVHVQIKQEGGYSDRLTLTQHLDTREKIVEQLLSLNQEELRLLLSQLSQTDLLLENQLWEMIPFNKSEETIDEIENEFQYVSS